MAEELSAQHFDVPAVFGELFKSNYKYFLMASGRISGKTKALVALWWYTFLEYPEWDIVILQSTETEIKKSIVNEIEKFLKASGFDVGDKESNMYCIPKSKERISVRGHKGQTLFFPMSDSFGGQRTRGTSTTNKIALVMYEEVQKNRDRDTVDHSIATFVRQLGEGGKIVVVGNNETVGHWFVKFVEDKQKDPDWCYIYSCYKDIWHYLNEETKKLIVHAKKYTPTEYRRMYLGDINASSSDVVFPQFNKEKHYKLVDELEPHMIRMLFIGIDHATANDKFASVPIAVLDNGEVQTLEVLCDDPKETQITLALSEQCDLFDRYLAFLDNKYGLSYNYVPVILSIDGASSPFIAQIKHTRHTSLNKRAWRNVQIKSFTAKHKNDNLIIIKNALAYNVITILNEGRYCWDGKINKHRLVHEIQSQRYKNGKLDPYFENDIVDALEYALVPYFTNCYNLSFPIRANDARYKEISAHMRTK